MTEILDWCIAHPGIDVGFEFYMNMFVLHMRDQQTNNSMCRSLPHLRILSGKYDDKEMERALADMFKELVSK